MSFDDELTELECSLRGGDEVGARQLLAAFDRQLAGYVQGEERALFPALERLVALPVAATSHLRREHASLRRLTRAIGVALDRADRRGGLDLLGSLRSVLLLHLTKEEWIVEPLLPTTRAMAGTAST